jgi:hypothetical protein
MRKLDKPLNGMMIYLIKCKLHVLFLQPLRQRKDIKEH